MRILAFILLSCTLVMCKTKSPIAPEQLLNYVVVLEAKASPKDLKKDISFELADFREDNSDDNQWVLNFEEDISKEKEIKAELLNHPKVMSAFTESQYAKMKSKSRSKKTSKGKKTATKQ